MPHLPKAVECLVCGKRTDATHMGMNACRACSIFYKRNHKKKLVCVNGSSSCLDYGRSIFWCRKCRLDRFESVLRAAWGEESSKVAEMTASHSPNRILPQCTNSIIGRIRANYNALSTFRRVAELELRGIKVDLTDSYDEKLDIIPSTYQCMNEGKKIQIDGLFKFIPSMFPEFRLLSNSDKWLLIRNYYRCFHCFDSALRVLRIYGKDSFNFFFGSYTTILSPDSIDYFFIDCPDQTHVATAAKTMVGTFHTMVTAMRNQIRQVDPSEDELLALMGLAFWSFENIDPSEKLLALAQRYRTAIISELTAHYRCTIGKEKGASRIGVLLCLLQEFRRAEMNLQDDYEIYHMLGAFDDETVTYKLHIR